MAASETRIQAARELEELYRAHAPEVYRYVYAVLGNPADAEDVTQTTFVNALRALERGEQPRKPANWLITIAHNLIRQRWRQQQTRPREVELDREIASVEADDDGPSIDDLVRALQRIPESQREALVLRELEGRSYKEIAPILGVSQSALETLLFRARRSLAEELENLVTCDRAELALSQRTDGRLGRKERKRLVAHLEECPSCARIAAISMKRNRAFRTLALLPLPLSLTLFKGAPSASAAIGLPAIGSGAAGGGAAVVGTGLAAKIAIGAAAVAVASGAGYEGVQAIRDPATSPRSVPGSTVPSSRPDAGVPAPPSSERAKLVTQLPRPAAAKTQRVKEAERGRSATAPGHVKTTAKPQLVRPLKPKPNAGIGPAVRGKSAAAPGKSKTAIAPGKAATPPGKSTTSPGKSAARGRNADAPDADAPGRLRAVEPKLKKLR